MIRLQTLGSLDLRAADGTSMQPVLRQTKRLALLAYLAVEKPGHFHRRDHLLGLFWPEADLKGGRASLSQAVHFLRQYLGKDAITNRGDEEIGLNPERVGCDAADFQTHITAGRFAEAMELYGGPLLPGIFVDEAEGFEQWAEQKRDTLQRGAMRACVALADAAGDRAAHDDVAHWLRRAIACFPYDENLHRRLITALDRAGDRAAALLAYEELVQTLKAEFEAEPSAETRQLIQQVRERSNAQVLPPVPPYGSRADDAPRSFAQMQVRPRRRWIAAAAITAMLIVGGVSWGAWSSREPELKEAPVNQIAVLYFNDASANRELGHVADGLTTALIEHLGNVRRIQVISQNGVRPFRGDSIPLDSVARQLRVGTIVGGTISRSGDLLRVNVEIVNGLTGVALRTRRFERPVGELFALLDDISREVASFLRSSVGEEIKLQAYQRETDNVAAWQIIQKTQKMFADADQVFDSGDLRAAAELYDEIEPLLARAIEMDGKWAAPHIMVARTHTMRAYIAAFSGDPAAQRHHLDAALASANRATQLDSRSASALEERGRVRFTRWSLLALPPQEAQSLIAAAEADLVAAVSIDADNARAESALSTIYETQGRFEEARRAALRALDADAYLEDAEQIVVRLFHASFEVGDDEQAGHWCDETRSRFVGRWPAAYCDLILLGWGNGVPADARKALYLLETFGDGEHADMRAVMRPRLAMLAAATVARAGDAARAEKLVADARAAGGNDPELAPFEAALWFRLNQAERGKTLLAEYLKKNPKAGPRLKNGRLYRPVHDGGRATAGQ